MFVELLDLGDLLVLFEVVGELVEGGKEVGDLDVLFVGTGDLELLDGVDHHDELFESVYWER